jgi:hypothetical protein
MSVWHLVKLIRAASGKTATGNTTADLYRGRLGIQVGSSPNGPIVGHIMPGTPAEEANLVAGDLILAVDGRRCRTPGDVIAAVTMSRAGDEVSLKLRRGEDVLERSLTLAKADEPLNFGSRFGGDPRRGAMPRMFMWQDDTLIPVDPTGPPTDMPLLNPQPLAPILPPDNPANPPQPQDETLEESRRRAPAAESRIAESRIAESPNQKTLEKEVERLEAENENQAATIDQLNQQIAALEAKAKQIIERTNSREIERLQERIDEIKRELLDQDRSD